MSASGPDQASDATEVVEEFADLQFRATYTVHEGRVIGLHIEPIGDANRVTAHMVRAVSIARMQRARTDLPPPAEARSIRIKAGLSQMDLAERLGVSYLTVSRWETGKNRPRGRALADYARALVEIGATSDD